MNNKIKNISVILFIIIVSIIALKALFHPGFYTSHDGWHIVARLFYFDQIVRDGQIPVRFSSNLLNGFGYPLFIFSYHLPWIIAEPFVLSGLNIFDSIKIVFILTYLLSGIFMYTWIKQMFGRKAALVSALMFILTPYRFANIFVRANIGEAVSFATYPLIFWSIYNLHLKKSFKWICIGALGLAGAFLSHVMVVALFFLPIMFYVIGLLFMSKNKNSFIIQLVLMLLLGIGLAAYYLLPAIYYKPITVFADLYKQLYINHFTSFSKLLYSPWGYGALGTPGEMSRQAGIVIWIINIIAVPLVIFNFVKKQNHKTLYIPLICLIIFSLSIFLMTKNSLSVWKMLENFALIDFPWRFLAVTTFISSILSGWIIFSLRNSKIQILLIFIILGALFYTNRNHIRINQYTDIPLSLYIDSELTTNTDDEYLPKWVDRGYAKQKHSLIVNQDLDVLSIKQKSNNISLELIASKPTNLQINQMWFPSWIASVNGINIKIDKTGFGGMAINVPSGKSQFRLNYTSTPIMIIGNILTIISIMIVVTGSLFNLSLWKKK